MKKLLLIPFLILNLANAKQFSYLDSQSTSFTIKENEAIRILNIRYDGNGENDGIRIERNGVNYDMRSRSWHDYNGNNLYIKEYVIVGPAIFSLYKDYRGSFPFVEFEIFQTNNNKQIVLPLPEEPSSLIIEASVDGENWTEVSSSPIISQKQFIQVSAP